MIERNESNASDKAAGGKADGGKAGRTQGLILSPRTYFGRASRAATSSLRSAISDPPPVPASAVRGARVYRGGDPAMRLFPGLTLPFPPTMPLTGAVATLSGVADGEHEKLLIDLGASLVRATPRRDEAAGTLSLVLSRTQSAETYRALLSSVRYVNDAPEPASGLRKVVMQTVDAVGTGKDVATATFGVGEMPPESVRVEAPAEAAAAPAPDRRVVVGETVTFNSDGDYTLFWWPRLLPAGRARRSRGAEPAPDAVPGSFFTQGGQQYRVFDPAPESASPPSPQRVAANQAAASHAAANHAATNHAATNHAGASASRRGPSEGEGRPANDVWMPGQGTPPPGFERAPMLRLEDIFGSDMDNAVTRRLIEQRVAAGG